MENKENIEATQDSEDLDQAIHSLKMELDKTFVNLHQKLAAVHDVVGFRAASPTGDDALSMMPSPRTTASLPKQLGPTGRRNSLTSEGFFPEAEPVSQSADQIELNLGIPAGLKRHMAARETEQQMRQGLGSKSAMADARAREIQRVQLDSHQEDGEAKDQLQIRPSWMELSSRSEKALEAVDSSHVASTRWMTAASSRISTASDSSLVAGILVEHQEEEHTFIDNVRWLPSVVSPLSNPKLVWDLMGVVLCVSDAFLLPISIAWDVGLVTVISNFGDAVFFLNFWTALLYWVSDFFVTFCTGYFKDGVLIMSRTNIAKNYLQSWFVFDIALICLDVVNAVSSSESAGDTDSTSLRSFRSLRALRSMRLLRLMKLGRLTVVIEEASVAQGRQWLVLVVSLVKTAFMILVAAHLLACFWYYVGRARIEEGRDAWLTVLHAEGLPGELQYLHALNYVLAPPAPPFVPADSGSERLYCLFIVISTVIVSGISLSRITGTLTELRSINSRSAQKRWDMRRYLQNQHVPLELTSRIMHFVDYKLKMYAEAVSLNSTLISPALQTELFVSQRSQYLEKIPMLDLAGTVFPEVFAAFCGAVEKVTYGRNEVIFISGSLAQAMYMTSMGTHGLALNDLVESPTLKLDGVYWFAEVSLFADPYFHANTLLSISFAEGFHFKGSDMTKCLMDSPACTSMFCEYAKDLIAQFGSNQRTSVQVKDTTGLRIVLASQMDASRAACEMNSVYQFTYPDKTRDLEEFDVLDAILKMTDKRRNRTAVVSQVSEKKLSQAVMSSDGMASPQAWAKDFVRDYMAGRIPSTELVDRLAHAFPELDSMDGTHRCFSTVDELEKTISSCISALALYNNDYELFTAPQNRNVKLKSEQWKSLQSVVAWAQLSEESLVSALILLAIRSLGKSKTLLRQLPESVQRPEEAVLYLIEHHQQAVPSPAQLNSSSRDLIINVLNIHKEFNLGQMLQAENLPANVLRLRMSVIQEGDEVFKFYMFFLLAVMSGLAGGEGSRFMNSVNSSPTILGTWMLKHVVDSEPASIYWNYVILRGAELGLPHTTPQDLALLRVACLGRIQDQKGFMQLRRSWELLGFNERQILANHFLADGITEMAYLMEFLPQCIAALSTNRLLSFHIFLEVLVDLLHALQTNRDLPLVEGTRMVSVDLKDMADFMAVVNNRYVFQTCVQRCKLRIGRERCVLKMTRENWTRTHEKESDTNELALRVQEIIERQKFMQEVIASEGFAANSSGSTGFSTVHV